jgi:hypothetical protein
MKSTKYILKLKQKIELKDKSRQSNMNTKHKTVENKADFIDTFK